jgi:hypothetical protein
MRWDKSLKETGCVLQQYGAPRHAFSEDNVERTRESLPHSTVHDVLRKRLKLLACKLQLVQKITREDHDSRKQFALEILSCIEEEETCLNKVVFF